LIVGLFGGIVANIFVIVTQYKFSGFPAQKVANFYYLTKGGISETTSIV
jgi:hypothetical protein